jgi:glutathione S-transferase
MVLRRLGCASNVLVRRLGADASPEEAEMLTLYHSPQTRSTRMIWLLEELGADYEIVYVDIDRGDGTGRRDPRNPHPDKKVPALVHDGALITESVAIMLYLTDLFPDAALGPKIGDGARGPYLTWLAYYAGVIEPTIIMTHLGLADHEGVARVFRGRPEIDRRILSALNGNDYLLGSQFSAADVLIASIGHWSREMLPQGEIMDAYIARCGARPALARAAAKDSVPVQA